MHPLTLTGLGILAVIVLAAVGGASTSGTTRLGRELGFVLGLLTGLAIALIALPHMGSRSSALILLLGATLSGGLFGAGALGGMGSNLARWLQHRELGALDRTLGAVLSGIGAIAICALALHLLILFAPDSTWTHNARHDVVAHWLISNPLVMFL
jgi:uncharacterized membrane protein required for colicin V production